MPWGLKRYYGAGDLHFITCSCYQRQPLLGTAQRRNLFLVVLEQVRKRYRCVVLGYVVMPEHFHLLIGEPEKGNPSTVMQVLKPRFARQLLRGSRPPHPTQSSLWDERLEPAHIWQRRFYDFVIWSQRKRPELGRDVHHRSLGKSD